ncbi:MAG: MarR family winged helix-turn-helix transcriptional regulator [Bacillota bacterium]
MPDEGTFEDLIEEIDYLLRRTSHIVRYRGRSILSNFDITPPQFTALVTIIHHDNLTMGALCRYLYLASSTVTDLINRMEKADLVERIRDEKDGRVIRLRAKPRGHELLSKVMAARIRYLSQVLGDLSDAEQQTIRDSLAGMYEMMVSREAKCDPDKEDAGEEDERRE